MRGLAIAGLSVVFVLSSCTNPNLTRWYQSAEFKDHSNVKDAPTASVSLFSLEAPSTSNPATVFSLGERGQAALIESLAAKSTTAKDLIAALATPIRRSSPAESIDDRSIVKRRVVLSIEEQAKQPGDRISTSLIRIEIPKIARFVSWDKLATKHGVVNLGEINVTKTFSISGEFGAAAPAVTDLLTATVKPSFEEELAEKVSLSQRYVDLNASLQPQKATILQEGAPGIDLVGNQVLDLDIKIVDTKQLDVVTVENIGDASKDPSKLNLGLKTVIIPSDGCKDVRADVTLEYVVRHVRYGDGSIIEGDDRATFAKGVVKLDGNPVLVPHEALRQSFWAVVDDSGAYTRFLGSKAFSAIGPTMFFETFDAALGFAQLLQRYPQLISRYGLVLGEVDTPAAKQLRGLSVVIARVNWSKC